MIANDVCEWDIQNVCEAKGYVTVDTLYMYEEVNPGFVDGVLVDPLRMTRCMAIRK